MRRGSDGDWSVDNYCVNGEGRGAAEILREGRIFLPLLRGGGQDFLDPSLGGAQFFSTPGQGGLDFFYPLL